MNDPRAIRNRLLAIAAPVCAGSGYELVDLDYESGNAGWVIRFYIDHMPASVGRLAGGISFEDCTTLSRELSAVLDVEDPVPHAYSLEVSSPGVDRPLRTADHFRAQLGQTVKTQLETGLDGRRNFKGRVLRVDDDGAHVVLDVDGAEFALPLADLDHARLVPDWNALLHGSRKPAGGAPKNQPGAKRRDKGQRPPVQD